MDYKAIAKWALGGSTGMSAKCIAQHLSGMKSGGSYPHDGGDFGRCEALLDVVPSFRLEFPRMAELNKYWAALVPRWDEIKESKDQCRLIQSIVRNIEDKDSSHVRLGNGISMRIGGTIE